MRSETVGVSRQRSKLRNGIGSRLSRRGHIQIGTWSFQVRFAGKQITGAARGVSREIQRGGCRDQLGCVSKYAASLKRDNMLIIRQLGKKT